MGGVWGIHKPVKRPPRRLPLAQKIVDKILKDNIKPSHSPRSAKVVLVKKKDALPRIFRRCCKREECGATQGTDSCACAWAC